MSLTLHNGVAKRIGVRRKGCRTGAPTGVSLSVRCDCRNCAVLEALALGEFAFPSPWLVTAWHALALTVFHPHQ